MRSYETSKRMQKRHQQHYTQSLYQDIILFMRSTLFPLYTLFMYCLYIREFRIDPQLSLWITKSLLASLEPSRCWERWESNYYFIYAVFTQQGDEDFLVWFCASLPAATQSSLPLGNPSPGLFCWEEIKSHLLECWVSAILSHSKEEKELVTSTVVCPRGNEEGISTQDHGSDCCLRTAWYSSLWFSEALEWSDREAAGSEECLKAQPSASWGQENGNSRTEAQRWPASLQPASGSDVHALLWCRLFGAFPGHTIYLSLYTAVYRTFTVPETIRFLKHVCPGTVWHFLFCKELSLDTSAEF